MYSLRNIFLQEPNAVRTAVVAILAALVVTEVIDISTEAVAAWGIVIEVVLTLFYVRPLSVSKEGLRQLKAKKGD